MIAIEGVSQGTISWIYKYSRKHYWKVAASMEFEDLLQEGFFCLQYCRNRYGEIDPPHLMRLVQITFYQEIINIVKRQNGLTVGMKVDEEQLRKKLRKEVFASDMDKNGDENRTWEKLLGEDPDQEFNVLIAEAPSLVKKVISLFLSGDDQLKQSYDKNKDGTKETTNQRVKRLLGIDIDVDIMKQVKDYLLGKEELEA